MRHPRTFSLRIYAPAGEVWGRLAQAGAAAAYRPSRMSAVSMSLWIRLCNRPYMHTYIHAYIHTPQVPVEARHTLPVCGLAARTESSRQPSLYHARSWGAGTMAVFILMLTFFMAIHSNVVALLLLGLPFDRQLPWHKLLALSTCFHSVIHLIAFYAGGRSDTMPDAEEPYHFSVMWRRNAYGMEVSGAPHCNHTCMHACMHTHTEC